MERGQIVKNVPYTMHVWIMESGLKLTACTQNLLKCMQEGCTLYGQYGKIILVQLWTNQIANNIRQWLYNISVCTQTNTTHIHTFTCLSTIPLVNSTLDILSTDSEVMSPVDLESYTLYYNL